jgi:hypothetical protein
LCLSLWAKEIASCVCFLFQCVCLFIQCWGSNPGSRSCQASLGNHTPAPCSSLAPNLLVKRNAMSWVVANHACNPSYLGDSDQEDCGSRPAWKNRNWNAVGAVLDMYISTHSPSAHHHPVRHHPPSVLRGAWS